MSGLDASPGARATAAMTRDPSLGFWLELPSPELAEIVAGAGFDFALVDLEHGMIGVETAQRMLMAFGGSATVPFIRVPDAAEAWIKRSLDAGAAAVMVPRVDDVETARRLAGFATYGPDGRRGYGVGVARAARWGREADGYLARWRGAGGLILQIESPDGLAAAAEIAAVPGVTQIFFGPSDFSASLGCGVGDPRVRAAGAEMARIARAAGKQAGTVTFPGGGLGELAAMGYTHALDQADISLLVQALDRHLAEARTALGRG
jgi:4-hydroxy-2-oxoheptanedioate aldolase